MYRFLYFGFRSKQKPKQVYVVKLADSQMQKTTIRNAKKAWPKDQKYQGVTTIITRYL